MTNMSGTTAYDWNKQCTTNMSGIMGGILGVKIPLYIPLVVESIPHPPNKLHTITLDCL